MSAPAVAKLEFAHAANSGNRPVCLTFATGPNRSLDRVARRRGATRQTGLSLRMRNLFGVGGPEGGQSRRSSLWSE